MEHNCIKTDFRPTDWIIGDGNIKLSGVSVNDWTPYFHFKEMQEIGFDTDCCVIFSASEICDAEIDYLISVGRVSQQTIDWFTSLGFMDSASDDGKPHFHSSPRYWSILTGNLQNGNNLYDPWDVARKYGAIPWTDLPFDASITTPAQYFAPIPQTLLDKGQQFILGVGGKNWVTYHWLYNNVQGTILFPTLDADRFATPLHIGINVGTNWNQLEPSIPPIGSGPGHSVTNITNSSVGENIYDHYNPLIKVLGNGYPIPQVLQAVITITPPPPVVVPVIPVLPTIIAPTQANVTLLTKIVSLYQQILALIQGRNLTSTQMLKGYNWSPLKQSVIDFLIKVGVFAGLELCNFVSAAISNGTIQFTGVTGTLIIGIVSLAVSQLDSKFIQWSQTYDVPLPPAAPTA